MFFALRADRPRTRCPRVWHSRGRPRRRVRALRRLARPRQGRTSDSAALCLRSGFSLRGRAQVATGRRSTGRIRRSPGAEVSPAAATSSAIGGPWTYGIEGRAPRRRSSSPTGWPATSRTRSTLRREADAQAVAFLPLIPRSAKRAMNHLRLRLYVGDQAGAVRGRTPRSLLAIWASGSSSRSAGPSSSAASSSSPSKLSVSGGGQRHRRARARGAGRSSQLDAVPSEDLLADFLAHPPRLGPVVEQLIFLEPARA